MKFKSFIFILFCQLTATVSFAQINEVWHSSFNGQGDFTDRYTCMILTDNAVFLGGSTQVSDQNQDFLLCKTDWNGNLIWRKQFHGSGVGPDEVKAIGFFNGKVIATGYGNSLGVGNDYYTFCYADNGDSLWTSVYNDPLYNQYDEPNDLAIDNSGNIYVTGESDRDVTFNTNHDYLTLKLDPQGNVVWTARYNGVANATDRAAAVSVDAQGQVYVTGRSFNGADDDYMTIKYNSSGTLQWANAVDNGGTDRATDMGMDSNGNVYVTGRRNNGNDDDFYTIKYNTSGTVLLQSSYDFVEDDRAERIAVRPDGSFVVTGRSDGNAGILLNYNIYTVAYSASGTQLWATMYTGTGNNDDVPTCIAALSDGTVAVGGFSDADGGIGISNNAVMIKYNTAGVAQSTINYNWSGGNDECRAIALTPTGSMLGAGLAEDADGRTDAAFFAETSANNAAVVFNSGQGDNNENVRDMVLRNDGTLLVAGYSVREGDDRDICTMALTANGDTLWTRYITGTLFGSDDDAANVVELSNSNVIVGGYIKNSGTGSDVVVQAYTSAGNPLWQSIYNGAASESDRVYHMVKDNANNVYLTGKTDIDPLLAVNDEVLTLKYSANGALLWANTYSSASGNDRGKFLQIASSGNLYVVARVSNGADDDIALIKYNAAGVWQWTEVFDSGGNDDPTAYFLDSSENMYVSGTSSESVDNLDTKALVLKWDAAGNLLWDEVYSDGGFGITKPESMVGDNSSAVYVALTSDADASVDGINNNVLMLKYSAAGVQQWEQTIDLSLDEVADDMVLGADNRLTILVHQDMDASAASNYDLALHRINTDGGQLTSQFFAYSDTSDVGNLCFLNGSQLYVAGSSIQGINQRDMLFAKFDITNAITEEEWSGMQAWPVPCHEVLTVSVDIPTRLEVYDASGRCVWNAQNNFQGQCTIDTSGWASGLYTLRGTNANGCSNKTVVKK